MEQRGHLLSGMEHYTGSELDHHEIHDPWIPVILITKFNHDLSELRHRRGTLIDQLSACSSWHRQPREDGMKIFVGSNLFITYIHLMVWWLSAFMIPEKKTELIPVCISAKPSTRECRTLLFYLVLVFFNHCFPSMWCFLCSCVLRCDTLRRPQYSHICDLLQR